MDTYNYQIFSNTDQLPAAWDEISKTNIFLQSRYLTVLTQAAPPNMEIFFVGLFVNKELAAVSLMQCIHLSPIQSVGNGKLKLQNKLRDFIMHSMASRVLFVGNNMLSGQNAFVRNHLISDEKTILLLQKASSELVLEQQKLGIKTHLISFKDFGSTHKNLIKEHVSSACFCFEIQPNMVFYVKKEWQGFDDYVAALNKKYRDQFKRARKKASTLQKRKLSLQDLINLEDRMNELYHFVASQASFNTFFLPSSHWVVFKENLEHDFLVYGYFKDDLLIGFNTLVRNGNHMETYFLGYDMQYQKEYMLYLNMLYDMIAFSINQGFLSVNFGRTALEIKSSVGAIAVPLHGFILHQNKLINPYLKYFFKWLEPKVHWEARNPFRD